MLKRWSAAVVAMCLVITMSGVAHGFAVTDVNAKWNESFVTYLKEQSFINLGPAWDVAAGGAADEWNRIGVITLIESTVESPNRLRAHPLQDCSTVPPGATCVIGDTIIQLVTYDRRVTWRIYQFVITSNSHPSVSWGSGSGGTYSREELMTHEFGHGLGLEHSCDASAVMWWTQARGTNKTTSTDDINGLRYLYAPGYSGPAPTLPCN